MLSTTNTLKTTNYVSSLNAAGEEVAFQTSFPYPVLKALQAAQGLITDPVPLLHWIVICWTLYTTLFSTAEHLDLQPEEHDVEALWKAEKRENYLFISFSETTRIRFYFPWHFTNCKMEPWAFCLLLRAPRVQQDETHMMQTGMLSPHVFSTNTYEQTPSLPPLAGGTHTPSNPSVHVPRVGLWDCGLRLPIVPLGVLEPLPALGLGDISCCLELIEWVTQRCALITAARCPPCAARSSFVAGRIKNTSEILERFLRRWIPEPVKPRALLQVSINSMFIQKEA